MIFHPREKLEPVTIQRAMDVHRRFGTDESVSYADVGTYPVGQTRQTPICRTHLGLDDSKDKMIRLQKLEDARKEVEKTAERPPVTAKQSMFRAD